MADAKKSYSELKSELDALLAWFDGNDLDIDEALKKYQEASDLISHIEKLLESASLEVKKLAQK